MHIIDVILLSSSFFCCYAVNVILGRPLVELIFDAFGFIHRSSFVFVHRRNFPRSLSSALPRHLLLVPFARKSDGIVS